MGIINSGVKQWVFQRIANALFVTFGVFLLWLLLSVDSLSYASLTALVSEWKWYLLVVLVFACVNAILAGWQIDGDYAKKFGIPSLVITAIAVIVSVIYLIYGLGLIF